MGDNEMLYGMRVLLITEETSAADRIQMRITE